MNALELGLSSSPMAGHELPLLASFGDQRPSERERKLCGKSWISISEIGDEVDFPVWDMTYRSTSTFLVVFFSMFGLDWLGPKFTLNLLPFFIRTWQRVRFLGFQVHFLPPRKAPNT